MSEPGASILLVEDDDDNRELMAEVLEAAGYEVVQAGSGPDALRQLEARRVSVVVTDLGMPGMGGLDVARAAKQRAPDVPIVLVTGYGDREDIATAREVDLVLVKPVDPDALTGAVERALRQGSGPGSR
jgi:CheY-like chemotaxis protein